MHLPREILRLCPDKKICVIQQNDDKATLKHMNELSRKKTLVLKAKPKLFEGSPPLDLFCVLHTPLWIKWQSYLEKHLKSEEQFEESGEGLDPHEQIAWSLETLYQFLEDPRYPYPHKLKDLLDMNVYSADDSHFSESLSRLKSAHRNEVTRQLRCGNLAALIPLRKIYLAEVTVNSCAQAAGAYLYRLWGEVPYLQSQDFYQAMLVECLSFFLSKVLNHSRRALSLKEWRNLSHRGRRQNEARAILRAQNVLQEFSKKDAWINSLQPFSLHAAMAHGRILADALFEAFLVGEFSKERLTRILTEPLRSEWQAYETLVEFHSIGRPFRPKNF